MSPFEDDRRPDDAPEPVEAAPPGVEEPADAPAAEAPADPAEPALAPLPAPTAPVPTGRRPEDVDLKLPLLILFGPVILVAIGSWLMPEIFYERFVKPYYWDPIVGDEGFTVINTATWALLMMAIIFLLWRVVQRIDQPVDFTLVAAVVPYMVAGSIARVLEDTGFFAQPVRYFFITPIIYVVIVAVAVFWIVVGHILRKHADDVGPLNAVKALGAFFAVVWLVYTVWSLYGDQLAEFGSPVVLLAALIVPLVYFWNHTKQTGRFSQAGVMATFGVAFLLYMVYYVVLWHTGAQWESVATDKFVPGSAGEELRPLVYIWMIVFPAIFTGAVYFIARDKAAAPEPSVVALAYLLPINLLLVFAQMMDASMTALGIDAYGYSEKHVLPAFLIGWVKANGGALSAYAATIVMIPIKLAVALLVVWAIDIYAKKDVEQYPDLVGLAKMAIIMVGLAPGVRDAVRLAMDV